MSYYYTDLPSKDADFAIEFLHINSSYLIYDPRIRGFTRMSKPLTTHKWYLDITCRKREEDLQIFTVNPQKLLFHSKYANFCFSWIFNTVLRRPITGILYLQCIIPEAAVKIGFSKRKLHFFKMISTADKLYRQIQLENHLVYSCYLAPLNNLLLVVCTDSLISEQSKTHDCLLELLYLNSNICF